MSLGTLTKGGSGAGAGAAAQTEQLVVYARELASAYELVRRQTELLPLPLDASGEAPRMCNAVLVGVNFPGLPALLEEHASDPAAILERLNGHLAAAVHAVRACSGVVEKFTAGGLLASFGARSSPAAAPELAVAAGMGVLGANERLNAERGSGQWLDVGVGVATGRAVLGPLGGSGRWEMGLLGDCVNIAGQLALKALGGEMLMDEASYRAVDSSIRARNAGQTWIRGRNSSVLTYRLKPIE